MSPAGTMMRVYAALKRRIMIGEFPAGMRLDPARLRDDLAASTTPIRDVLHRLTGEGLVESWQNEGFRIPYLGESELRDQYEWSRLLVRAAIDSAVPGPIPPVSIEDVAGAPYAERVSCLLQTVAALSANLELRRAMTRLCDRAFPARDAEFRLLTHADDEIGAIERQFMANRWTESLILLDAFHDARVAIIPGIASWLRRASSRS